MLQPEHSASAAHRFLARCSLRASYIFFTPEVNLGRQSTHRHPLGQDEVVEQQTLQTTIDSILQRSGAMAEEPALTRLRGQRNEHIDATVMLIDDDAVSIEVIQILLEIAGYRKFITCPLRPETHRPSV